MDVNLKKFFTENGLVDEQGETFDPPYDDADGWRRSFRAAIQCLNFMLDEQEAAVENRRGSKYLIGLNVIGDDLMEPKIRLQNLGLNVQEEEARICDDLGLGFSTVDERYAQNREFMKRMRQRREADEQN
ncbi:hypothetical protein L3556_13815 [Candidatus Synechococcus calcipolaris G9]|uniref:Uncharacterized protein n=1 Tax=Candidatus Synechococcus calcipolaris G9 TaxID=1497997 RepID=A0ABT6F2D9_9SYNE|nr:hypothetical protein [Candidatus Synechococcus calcipolaris]MDG2991999.1 hypothetical protein [Candidatus Synechococcus calcipolaris G9]